MNEVLVDTVDFQVKKTKDNHNQMQRFEIPRPLTGVSTTSEYFPKSVHNPINDSMTNNALVLTNSHHSETKIDNINDQWISSQSSLNASSKHLLSKSTVFDSQHFPVDSHHAEKSDSGRSLPSTNIALSEKFVAHLVKTKENMLLHFNISQTFQ